MVMIRDRSSKQYIDPNMKYIDQEMVPEGMTFPALSTVPKEYLRDPNAPLPSDRNPMDWAMASESGGNDNSTDERNQRAYLRDYLSQKYDQASSTKGVDEALANQKRENQWADAGYGIDRMLMAHSAARGGPGADSAYWQGLKKTAAGEVGQQESLRQAKIKDYLMKQRLGSEGVDEMQQMHGYDQQNEMADPSSNISRSYQNAFEGMFPEEASKMGGDVPNMSAKEIDAIAKMYGAKTQEDLKRAAIASKVREAEAAKPLAEAKLANIRANTALTQKRTQQAPTVAKANIPEGMKALDRDYAKDYNDWTVTGRSDYQKNMQTLEEAYDEMNNLESKGGGSSVSGKWEGGKSKILGDTGRSEQGLVLQKKVERAVIGSLKAVAGANPTEGERAAILSTAFNVNLPLKENIKNVKSIIDDLNNRAIRNEEKAKHFEQNKTLEGYKGQGVERMVKIQAPDGSIRPVPESKVDKYLQKGGKVVQ